jgi:hypothetical protein
VVAEQGPDHCRPAEPESSDLGSTAEDERLGVGCVRLRTDSEGVGEVVEMDDLFHEASPEIVAEAHHLARE